MNQSTLLVLPMPSSHKEYKIALIANQSCVPGQTRVQPLLLSPLTCHNFMNPSVHASQFSLFTSNKSPPSIFDSSITLRHHVTRFFNLRRPTFYRNKMFLVMVVELVGTMLFMVVKPFSLFKLCCMAAVRATSVVINTWVEIMCAFIYFNISIFWRFIVWSLSLLTLPARALIALHREKQLKAQLNELQDKLVYLECDRKELQEHIRVAIKEHEMMEMVLVELEEEHDEAIHKIKLLETELQDLKDENHRVNEVKGKSQWDTDSQIGHYKITNIRMHKDDFDDVNKGKLDAHDYMKNDFMHQFINQSVCLDNIFGERREVAVSQSLFSAMLSLLVAMVIWEAEEPCMPLITALFMVVGMSLKSVVKFLSTIKNKPASDAIALLSLNWFILGILAYPTLPTVAHLSAPLFTYILGKFGFSFRFD